MSSQTSKMNIEIKSNVWIEFIYCPNGEYMMGGGKGERNPAEQPQHQVIISKGFWISSTPITREQYSALITREHTHIYENESDSPASQHTWLEAVEFCEVLELTLNKNTIESASSKLATPYHVSLPTEEQWEYACRAGTDTKWHFGDNASELENYAWFGQTFQTFKGLPSVKQKSPNGWGLYDMYGMVSEWCLNDHYKYAQSTSLPVTYITHSQKSIVLKSVRGGSITSNLWECRSASRDMLDHWNSYNDLTGFRIVINQT